MLIVFAVTGQLKKIEENLQSKMTWSYAKFP